MMTRELLSTLSQYSYDQIPDLTNTVALITGANIGIGYATTLALVAHGAHVVMACRSEAKAHEAIEQLHKDVAEKHPHSTAAAQISKGETPQAGVLGAGSQRLEMGSKVGSRVPLPWTASPHTDQQRWHFERTLGLSADGIERHFAVNHLGHFVLTIALLSRLKESQPSRVVTVSSIAYDIQPPGGFNLSIINDEIVGNRLSRYGRSKLAVILFAIALARRLANEQVYVNSLHPGLVDARMSRHSIATMTEEEGVLFSHFPPVPIVTVQEGALTQLYLATSPEMVKKNIRGRFFLPVAVEHGPTSETLDVDLQENLWGYSEKIVKEKTGR